MSERSEQPWTFEQARQKCRQASSAQEAAERTYRESSRDFALKEEAYRLALATEILRAHNDGVAWSTAPDLARGDEKVAKLRRERDISKGVMDAMEQSLWRHVADRKDAQRFSDWSQRREFAEAYGRTEPAFETPIGGVRA